jgi:hypothetical protein
MADYSSHRSVKADVQRKGDGYPNPVEGRGVDINKIADTY